MEHLKDSFLYPEQKTERVHFALNIHFADKCPPNANNFSLHF